MLEALLMFAYCTQLYHRFREFRAPRVEEARRPADLTGLNLASDNIVRSRPAAPLVGTGEPTLITPLIREKMAAIGDHEIPPRPRGIRTAAHPQSHPQQAFPPEIVASFTYAMNRVNAISAHVDRESSRP